MKVKLADIESQVEQTDYLAAEALLDQQALQNLKEVEFNLWTGWITAEGKGYEVEVQLRGTTVLKSTCDCSDHSDKKYCAHVLAALLAIRQEKSKPPKIEKIEPSISNILPKDKNRDTDFIEDLPDDELNLFVKKYAKQDKRFLLALKVHFATQVDALQDEQAYQNILESTQRSTRRAGKRFSFQSQRDYLKVVDKLIKQNKLAYQNQDWRASFDLTFALLKNLFLNLPFTDKAKRPFLDRCRQVLSFADDLAALPLAPELEEDFLQFFLQHLQKDGLAFKYLGAEMLSCARKKSIKPAAQHELLDIVEALRENMEVLHPHWINLSICQLDLAAHLGEDILFKLSHPEKIHQDIYLSTLAHLENRFAFSALKKLTSYSRQIHTTSTFTAALDEFDLSMAIRENDQEKITALAKARLFESGKVSYYQLLKKANSEITWIQLRTDIFDALANQSQTPKIQDLMGEIFRFEKKPSELLAYARENHSMAVMREHAQWLFDRLPEELKECYPQIIEGYAQQHVGPVAAEQINLGLQELRHLFGEAYTEIMVTQLKNEYPNRHALMGSLASL